MIVFQSVFGCVQLVYKWFKVVFALAVLAMGSALAGHAQLGPANTHYGSQKLVVDDVSNANDGFEGIAVDSKGNLYIAACAEPSAPLYNLAVCKETLQSNGTYVESILFDYANNGLKGPYYVAVDSSDNVYISDAQGQQVVKETLSGGTYTQSVVTNYAAGGLIFPAGIAVDSSGNVYVADFDNQRVLKETLSGSTYTQSVIGSGFQNPSSVAVDPSGNVYVADIDTGNVYKEALSGGAYTQSILVSTNALSFTDTCGLATDSQGNVYIIESGGTTQYDNQVIKVSPSGAGYNISVISSAISYPWAAAVDSSGNIFVSGFFNQVTEISTPPTSFGTVAVGATSAVKTFPFTVGVNLTTASAAAALTLGAGSEFTDVGTGTCDTNGTSHIYKAGETCTVDVTFSPQFAGLRSGAVVLINPSKVVQATMYISGTGTGPQVAFSPGVQSVVASGFTSPAGVSVDGSGVVYITDSGNSSSLFLETPAGSTYTQTTVGIANTASPGPIMPQGVAVDGAGNVYFADSHDNYVDEEFFYKGQNNFYGTLAYPTLGNALAGPTGLAADSQGNVYVADTGNNRVVEELYLSGNTYNTPPNYEFQDVVASGLKAPQGVAADGSGNVYIADTGNNRILKETPSGGGNFTQSVLFDTGLSAPAGVAIDDAGDLFIADTGNQRVLQEMVTGTGYTQSVVALTGLGSPQAIAVDAGGDLFIADATNGNVIKLARGVAPTLTFASTADGATSSDSPQTVTLENVGTAPLTFALPSTGDNPSISANFSLSSTGGTACPLLTASSSTASLAANATCTLPISFTPTGTGSLSGSLILTDNALNIGGGTQTIVLDGTGTAAAAATVTLAPASLTFASQSPSTTSTAQTVTLTNTGTVEVTGITVSLTGANPSDFAETTTCGATLAAGTNCTIAVTFTPASAANFAATLSVADSATGSPQTVALTGTGSGNVTASPTSLNLGSEMEFTENYTPQYITLTNSSNATITFSNFQSADPLEFYSQAYTCGDDGVLLGQTSCEISVRFQPLSVGLITSTITMPYTGGGGGTLVVDLSGTGTIGVPTIDVEPVPIVLGTLSVGTAATPVTVQVEDGGTAPLTGITVSISGANAGDYSQTNTCSGVTVDPYPGTVETCNITVNFTPTSGGGRVAALNVTSNGGAATFSTPLIGAGSSVMPQIQFTPTQLNLSAGVAGVCGDATGGGAATSATLCNVNNAAEDYLGNTYLVDTNYNVVYKVDTTGAISVFAGTPSTTGGDGGDGGLATAAELQNPTAVATDAYGNVYISDTGNGAIREVDAVMGDINTVVTNSCYANGIGKPEPRRQGPAKRKDILGYACQAAFQPEGLVFDGQGNLYFADPADNYVWELPTSGDGAPGGAGIGVFVVAGFSPDEGAPGNPGYTGDNGMASVATLNGPKDVAVDMAGNVYIADTVNNVIRMVTTSTGIITTFAGNGTQGNSGDGGAATSAEVTAYGVATNLGGDVFIAAGTGGLVRKVDTSGNITTFAGGGTGAIGGVASSAGIANAYFVRADNAGDLLIPTGLQVLTAGPDGLLQFGTVSLGSTSAALTATVENTGDSNLSIDSAGTTITGANAGDFTVSGNNCGTALAPSKTCALNVTFTPSAAGARTAAVSVGTNAAGTPQTVLLQGNGSAVSSPAASLSPATLSFPSTMVGATATAMVTTLSNTGNAVLNITGITLAGTNPGDFAETTTCGATLAASATCTISVTFTPAAAASYTATLSVADDATGSPQTAALSGTGLAAPVPAATLTPSSVSFANTVSGVTTAAQTLTLSNTGNAVLNISGITLGGTNPADFAETTTCGTTLAANASCTIAVTFTPASVASFTATVSVADDAGGSPQSSTLSGTGVNAPDFTVSASTPAATVQPGGVASYPIVVAATNGDFSGAVVLTATGLPPGATASFAPASVTPGSSSATSTLTIQTGGAQAQLRGRLPWLPVSALAFCVPLLWWRRRSRGKLLNAGLLCALLSVTAMFATGCGGGYYLNTSKTYTVTVTGTSGSSQHSTTVTLTIE